MGEGEGASSSLDVQCQCLSCYTGLDDVPASVFGKASVATVGCGAIRCIGTMKI